MAAIDRCHACGTSSHPMRLSWDCMYYCANRIACERRARILHGHRCNAQCRPAVVNLVAR